MLSWVRNEDLNKNTGVRKEKADKTDLQGVTLTCPGDKQITKREEVELLVSNLRNNYIMHLLERVIIANINRTFVMFQALISELCSLNPHYISRDRDVAFYFF